MSQVDPGCRAFQAAIDVLARPWSGLILGLLGAGGLRFSELEERAHGVGAKTLSARLKDLETRGLVVRSVDTGPPIRVRYTLSARGVPSSRWPRRSSAGAGSWPTASRRHRPSGPLRGQPDEHESRADGHSSETTRRA